MLLSMKTLKKVPTNVLQLNNDFALNNELGYSLEYRLTKFCQENAYNDELVVQYEGPKEEPIPPVIDLGTFVPLNLALLITFACHKENLLLNVGNMR